MDRIAGLGVATDNEACDGVCGVASTAGLRGDDRRSSGLTGRSQRHQTTPSHAKRWICCVCWSIQEQTRRRLASLSLRRQISPTRAIFAGRHPAGSGTTRSSERLRSARGPAGRSLALDGHATLRLLVRRRGAAIERRPRNGGRRLWHRTIQVPSTDWGRFLTSAARECCGQGLPESWEQGSRGERQGRCNRDIRKKSAERDPAARECGYPSASDRRAPNRANVERQFGQLLARAGRWISRPWTKRGLPPITCRSRCKVGSAGRLAIVTKLRERPSRAR